MDYRIEMRNGKGEKIGLVQTANGTFKTNSKTAAQLVAEEMKGRPANKDIGYKVVQA